MVLPNIEDAYEIGGEGILINKGDDRLIWIGSGFDDPTADGGIAAPIGSTYYRTSNGSEYKKTGSGDIEWTLAGLGSDVISGGIEHGKQGVVNVGHFLERVGGVSTNIVGTPINKANAKIRGMIVDNELEQNFSIQIFQHDGKLVNKSVLHTIAITDSSGAKTESGLSISIGQNKQIGSEVTSGSAKNVGLNIDVKGTS